MKKAILFFAVIASSVFADPCTYLTKRQCNYEKQFCQFEEGYSRQGECVVREKDRNDVFKQTYCNAPNGTFWIERSEKERSKYCQSNGCDWIPEQSEPAGCFLRDEILNG